MASQRAASDPAAHDPGATPGALPSTRANRFSRAITTNVLPLLLVLAACTSPVLVPATPPYPSTPTPAVVAPAVMDDLAALQSLRKVDDHPLYTMHYAGEPRAASVSLAAAYQQGLATGQRSSSISNAADESASTAWACSLFAVLHDPEQRLYGRNFDWEYSPALLLFMEPPTGFASISMVDIAYLGFSGARSRELLDLPLEDRRPLLQAPFLPFDGMNEAGLVVGMAAVPSGQTTGQPDTPQSGRSIGSLGIIRELLDHAANVEEAVALMATYDIDFRGGPPLHYLLADTTGRSALVEFYGGEMVVYPSQNGWDAATNFLRSAVEEDASGQCWRHDAIVETLGSRVQPFSLDKTVTGEPVAFSEADALALLSQVAQPNTQWSVVYGMSSLDVQVAMGRDYDRVHTFALEQQTEP